MDASIDRLEVCLPDAGSASENGNPATAVSIRCRVSVTGDSEDEKAFDEVKLRLQGRCFPRVPAKHN